MENSMTRILVLALTLTLFTGAPAHAASVGIAAIVGEDAITTTDLAERRDLLMATANIPATEENQRKIAPRVIQSLVDEALQLQEAKRQSITVTDEEITKSINDMNSRSANGGSVRDFIKQHGLSERSLENQVRAQLAWGKVVQRKLRRNVTVSQDEVARAQKSAAASPGEEELRIAALDIDIKTPAREAAMKAIAEDALLQLKSGADMASVAARYIKQPEVHYNMPIWVPVRSMPPALQQVMRTLKPGEYAPPQRSASSIQIIQMLERKTSPKLADSTEYALKQIAISVPKKRDQATLAKIREITDMLRSNPGECMSDKIPFVTLPTDVKFIRTRLGALSPEQRALVTHLEVGQVSDPFISATAIRLVILCEKVESAGDGGLPEAEKIRQELFADKMELEAQKHLRNLRRDAYIDIKDVN